MSFDVVDINIMLKIILEVIVLVVISIYYPCNEKKYCLYINIMYTVKSLIKAVIKINLVVLIWKIEKCRCVQDYSLFVVLLLTTMDYILLFTFAMELSYTLPNFCEKIRNSNYHIFTLDWNLYVSVKCVLSTRETKLGSKCSYKSYYFLGRH